MESGTLLGVGGKCLDLEARRLLSEVGLEAYETVELTRDLPTRGVVYDEIRKFLRSLTETKVESSSILWIVGEWGQGKSAAYEGIIRKCSEVCSVDITASQVVAAMGSVPENVWDPLRFLWGLAKALSEKYNIRIPDFESGRESSRRVGSYILHIYKAICRDEKPFLIFIDEFEDVVERALREGQEHSSGGILDTILNALVELKNGNVYQLKELRIHDKVHFAIAITKAAESRLLTLKSGEALGIKALAGRFQRRIYRVVIENMLGIEALIHAQRLLSYIFGKNVTFKTIADPPALMNFITISSLGMPAAVERMVNSLILELNQRGHEECAKGIRKLTVDIGEDVFSYLQTVLGEGEPQNIFLVDSFHRYKFDCQQKLSSYLRKPREHLSDFCSAILLTRGGISEDYVISNFFGGDRETAARALWLLESFNIINRLKAYELTDNVNLREIIKALNIIVNEEKRSERFAHIVTLLSSIAEASTTHKALGAGFTVFSTFIDPLIYISDSGKLLVVLPNNLELIKRIYGGRIEIEPYLAKDLVEFLKKILSKLKEYGLVKEHPDVWILNPELQSEIFFSPEVATLKFISKRKRANYWSKARKERDAKYVALALTLPVGRLINLYFGRRAGFAKAEIISQGRDEGFAVLRLIAKPAKEGRADGLIRFSYENTYYKFEPELRADVLVVNAQAMSSSIEEYITMLRKSRPWENPHVILIFKLGEVLADISRLIDIAREELGIAVKEIPLSALEYLRLTALGLVLSENYGVRPDLILEHLLNQLFSTEEGTPRLPGDLLPEQLRSYVIDIAEKLSLDNEETLINELSANGILLQTPPTMITLTTKDGESITLDAKSLRHAADALKWIGNFYFGKKEIPLEGRFSLDEVFKTVLESVRRHTIFGLNYSFIGIDIESGNQLLNLLAPFISDKFKLFDIEIKSDEQSGLSSSILTFKIVSNPYFYKLVKLFTSLGSTEINLEQLLKVFTIQVSSTAREAIETFLKAFSNLAIIDIHVGDEKKSKRGRKSQQELRETIVEWMLSKKKIHEIITRLNNYLTEIEKNEKKSDTIRKLGYIVSGKLRNYSASYTPSVLNGLKRCLNDAEFYVSSLRSTDRLKLDIVIPLSLKLKYAVAFTEEAIVGSRNIDLRTLIITTDLKRIDYDKIHKILCKTHLGIIDASEYYIQKVLREIESNLSNLKVKWITLLANLEDYVFRKEDVESLRKILVEGNEDSTSIELRTLYYRKLKELKEYIINERDSYIPEEAFYTEVERLWKKYFRGNGAPNFPFYFKGFGPCYLYNYKVYKIKRAIHSTKINDVNLAGDLDIPLCYGDPVERYKSEGITVLDKIREKIENIITTIKSYADNLNRLNDEYKKLLNTLKASKAIKGILGEEFISKLPKDVGSIRKISITETSLGKLVSTKLSNKPYGSKEDQELNDKELVSKIKEAVDKWLEKYGRDPEEQRREIYNIVSRINTIDAFYSDFITIHDKILKAKEILEKYNISEYSSELEEHLNNLREIIDKIRSDVTNIVKGKGTLTMKTIRDTIEKLHKSIVNNYRNNMERIDVESLRTIMGALGKYQRELSKYNDELRNIMKPLSKISEHVKELQSLVIELHKLSEKINRIMEDTKVYQQSAKSIKDVNVEQLDSLLQQIINDVMIEISKYPIRTIRSEMFKAIDKLDLSYTEKEVMKEILLLVEEKSGEEKLGVSEIISRLKGKMSTDDIGRAIITLISKGYLEALIII